MTMETVAFYSYKGGVGRTLLLANAAEFLAMSGRKVVALDLDLEAPGLHHKLGGEDAVRRAREGTLPGVVDWLVKLLTGEGPAPCLAKTALQVDLPLGTQGSLHVLPAGSAPSATYWETLQRLHSQRESHTRSGGLAESVLELQARVAQELNPDFLLIDSRTGITELAGLATSVLADRVVCLTTSAPESVHGTEIIAESLRAAPRLSSQQPLRLHFVLTRVTSESPVSPQVQRVTDAFDDEITVLPHDSAMADEEQILSRWRLAEPGWDEAYDSGTKLFSATLRWLGEMFPGHQQSAAATRRRMEAIHQAWQQLTAKHVRGRGGTASRSAWPVEQLRQRVRFGDGADQRQADIVVLDSSPDAAPLMIIEYLEGEDSEGVAKWWLAKTKAKVIAVMGFYGETRYRKLYSSKTAWDSRAGASARWDLPLPHDFEALPDPTDVSIDALLDAVTRGHPEYLGRIVREWVHCSAATLHGGAPWKPDTARRILDGLARVDDVEMAKRVLWATSPDPYRQEMWLGDRDEWVEEQVRAELFAPLLWRLPPEAAIAVMQEPSGPHGPPRGRVALALLARDGLGLHYDPDALFRRKGQRILEREREPGKETDSDKGLYELAGEFRDGEIRFEITSDAPPLARGWKGKARPGTADLAALVTDRMSQRALVTTGLLGDYNPKQGRVVLYREALATCAQALALQFRHLAGVTLIHESLHALMHVAVDLDDRTWPEFHLPRADTPLFEPSLIHEPLAQYFTYRHILRLGDRALRAAFEALSERQAPPYRVWRDLEGLPLEDARSWLMNVRRPTGPGAPPALVEALRRAQSS